MGKDTKIEWCDHTFNPWIGCTHVSPGCVNCYAETLMAKRMKAVEWGPGKARKRTSAANWKQSEGWNRVARRAQNRWEDAIHYHGDDVEYMSAVPLPTRPRVFCASLADWLDPEVPVEWLADLLALIHATPNLDWLLLTKRPEKWRERMDAVARLKRDNWMGTLVAMSWTGGNNHVAAAIPPNIWIGTTVEDQRRADERIPELLKIPARVRFLSCEPLLGPVDLNRVEYQDEAGTNRLTSNTHTHHLNALLGFVHNGTHVKVDWTICGGESGPNARPMHPDWARGLRDQCQAAGVPFLFKQWGEWCPIDHIDYVDAHAMRGTRGWDHTVTSFDGGRPVDTENGMARIGKHRAGRMLDGREHNAFPEVGHG